MLSVVRPPGDAGVLTGAPETPGCAAHAKRWVLLATVLGSSTAFVEGSVINVALPAIQQGLGAGVGAMQWIASVFTLLLATLTLVAGAAGDRFGRRRLFVAGLVILALASVAAGLAASSAALIAARAAQGVGGALLVPNSLALLAASFPKAERGRAIGTWSAFTALTNSGGPILGGVLVDQVSWRAGFFAVVPLALAAMALALARVPDVRIGWRRPEVDWRGAALATAGMTVLVFGIIRLSADRTIGVAAIGAGVGLTALLLAVEERAASPMMPPSLFRSRTFLGANLLTLLLYFALTGVFFILPFDLVRARGYSATATGATYLPFAVVMTVLSRWAGGLVDRFGARLPLVVGPCVAACGFALFARPIGDAYWTSLFPPMVVVGLGMAVTAAPLTATVMGAVAESEVGTASGVNNTVARVASLLAVAIVGLLALSVFQRDLTARLGAIDLRPEVRSALATDAGRGLGEANVPAGASAGERRAVERCVAEALGTAFRAVALLAAALAAAAGLLAGLLIESKVSRPESGAIAAVPCAHRDLILDVDPRSSGCEECLRIGSSWVHLRLCLACGHVGCCDASRHRHATAHFFASGHPIVRSLEPGETWRWCYVDEIAV